MVPRAVLWCHNHYREDRLWPETEVTYSHRGELQPYIFKSRVNPSSSRSHLVGTTTQTGGNGSRENTSARDAGICSFPGPTSNLIGKFTKGESSYWGFRVLF
jgi:hypothetical protein